MWLSAKENSGLSLLQLAIQERLSKGIVQLNLKINFNRADLRAKFYQLNAVEKEKILEEEQEWVLAIRAPILEIQRIFAHEDNNWQNYILK